MSVAIATRSLGKSYRIRHETDASYQTLRDLLARGLSWRGRVRQGEVEEFWALRDVDFEIRQGERVGIIGRNGAGKSTLLKLLSRITEPTKGAIRIRGRVSSLLEVGTGFHPELTGRENIYLNGAILGMSRREVSRRFDEIVDFAEVEKFLDTPVKRYSSGMYTRLAFAVAAHLEADILLVDEVLAVGDVEFQRKCLGTMESISRSGRTIVFVSHNMQTISSLCQRVLLIDEGRIALDAPPKPAISAYFRNLNQEAASIVNLADHSGRPSTSAAVFRQLLLKNSSGELVSSIPMGESLHIELTACAPASLKDLSIGIGICDAMGRRVASLTSLMLDGRYLTLQAGEQRRFRFEIDALRLVEGTYYISLYLVASQSQYIDMIDRAARIDVTPADLFGTGKLPASEQGVVVLCARFRGNGLDKHYDRLP